MAIAENINLLSMLAIGQKSPHRLSAAIVMMRHAEKAGAAGDLTPDGWMHAEAEGVRIGRDASDSGVHSIQVIPGTVNRTAQTAEAIAIGARHAGIRKRGGVDAPSVALETPRVDLSLSAIAPGGRESVFVQRYLERTRGAQDAVGAIPRPITMLLHIMRHSQLEAAQQEAAGKVLLEWLELDGDRMQLPNGEPDPHTRSAREVAREQAVLLRDQIHQVVENLQSDTPVEKMIINCSHENFVLLWARYFLYQEVKSRRRGQPNVVLRGMDIVKKIGGKIPYLSGIRIHFFKATDGTIRPRARFNNAWYEIDMNAIDQLAEEAHIRPESSLVKRRLLMSRSA